MNKTVSTLFVAIMAVAIFSCSKSADSTSTSNTTTTEPNKAMVGGVVTDLSLSSYVIKQDNTAFTFVGNGGVKTGTTYENSVNFTLASKKALKIGTFSAKDTVNTSQLYINLYLGSKRFSNHDNTVSVTITKLDTLIAGTYSATLYSNDTLAASTTKIITGNFSAKY